MESLPMEGLMDEGPAPTLYNTAADTGGAAAGAGVAVSMLPSGRPKRTTANAQPSYAENENFWDAPVTGVHNEDDSRPSSTSPKGKDNAVSPRSASNSSGGGGSGGFPRQLLSQGSSVMSSSAVSSAGTSMSSSPTPTQSSFTASRLGAGGGAGAGAALSASATSPSGAGAGAGAAGQTGQTESSPSGGTDGYVVSGTNQRLSLHTVAADSARLDAGQMSVKEQQIFSDWVSSPALKNLFLKMRNGILALWYQDCYTELTVAVASATAPKTSTGYTDERFAGVHRYLNHSGFINFGVFKQRPQPTLKPGQRRRKIVVIGAGVSGLAAARKLNSLGYEVMTLEGKDYVGGRVNSYKWGKYTADLGAMVITGLGGGNPLYTLCRQVNLKTYSVRGVCPLHDHTGKRIGKQLDDELESEFNSLLDETRSIGKHAKKMPELSDKKLSLGDAFDMAVKVSMRRCQNMWSGHLSKLTHTLQELDHITAEIVTAEKELLELCKEKFNGNPPLSAADAAAAAAASSTFTAGTTLVKVEMDVDPLTADVGPATVATPSNNRPSQGSDSAAMHAPSLDPLIDTSAAVVPAATPLPATAVDAPPPAAGLPPPAAAIPGIIAAAAADAGKGAPLAPIATISMVQQQKQRDQQQQHQQQQMFQQQQQDKFKMKVQQEQRQAKNNAFQAKVKQVGGLKSKQAMLEADRRTLAAQYPTKYWTGSAKSVIDWHVANLEFANATTLDTLSLEHWDQDDANEFSGEHLTIKDGFGTVPKALATGLSVKMKRRVTNVHIDPAGGARVSFRGVDSEKTGPCDTEEVIEADAVLVTVPLGVLKDGAMKFDPPLPGWKSASIERLGFGLLNKVILCFDTAFWTAKFDTFGCCSPPSGIVGELYMFWNFMPCTGQPILLALNAGEAAKESEKESDEVVIAKAVAVLRNVFSVAAVPEPVHAHVTRWRQDEFARGSYSYVSVDATGDDYDQLAEPVTLEGAANPQLFFAGEHTNRNYPATVHGAMLSGLREAGRIADTYPPFMPAGPGAATTGGAAVATAGVATAAAAGGAPPPATTLLSSDQELGTKRKPEDLDAPPDAKKIAF